MVGLSTQFRRRVGGPRFGWSGADPSPGESEREVNDRSWGAPVSSHWARVQPSGAVGPEPALGSRLEPVETTRTPCSSAESDNEFDMDVDS